MAEEEIQFPRIDLAMKILRVDREKGVINFVVRPHPRRYERKQRDGKDWVYDKLDDLWFPEEAFFKRLAESLEGTPVGIQRQEIDSAEDYVNTRIPQIRKMLTGTDQPMVVADKSEDFLNSLSEDKLEFAILSVDIVESTRLSTVMPAEAYSRLIRTTLFELSALVPKFLGHVLKYTGDGLIAYFPAPSFIRMNDMAMDCALTMHHLLYRGVNPVLKAEGYQTIDIRIGIDSGDACIVAIGSPESKRHKDIIGSVVSLAAKIQSVAGAGGLALGDTAVRNLHVMWREICQEVELKADWPYKDQQGQPYRVHRVVPGRRLKSVGAPE